MIEPFVVFVLKDKRVLCEQRKELFVISGGYYLSELILLNVDDYTFLSIEVSCDAQVGSYFKFLNFDFFARNSELSIWTMLEGLVQALFNFQKS